jgi:hypothetical protein
MRERGEGDVNGGRLQLALRDLRAHLAQPATAAGLVAIAAVLGVSGPFDTLSSMRWPERALYWALVTGLTYPAGFLVGHLLQPVWQRWGALPRVLMRSALTCLCVLLILNLLALLFGRLPGQMSLADAGRSVALVFAVCLVIDVLGEVLDRQPGGPTGAVEQAAPVLLSRLPFDLRGPLVALRGEDHYVHVTTTKGRHMVLMRLADAIAETAPEPGLRVHRSHWVALAQVKGLRRQGDGAVLTLSNGAEVPASRSAMPTLRDAGLL